MALFTPSTIPWVSTVNAVADSAGATADSEMTQRAHLSLRAAFQYFNGRSRWNFLRVEGTPITFVAPFGVTGISASAGQATAALPAGHGFLPDDIFLASGYVVGTRIVATASTSITLNTSATGFSSGVTTVSATAYRDSYDLPTDWKAGYSIRLLGAQKALKYMGRRVYDRSVSDEFSTGTPEWYDLYNAYGRSKIRILPPPSSVDVLLHRYYRRMFLASASSVATTAIDIPEDYEAYPIAWAKWHFLTDKREQGGQQATTWLSLATEGLKTMMADQADIPDETLQFIPDHAVTNAVSSDKTTRWINWET